VEIARINLIDEELIAKDRTTSLIHIYISECDNAMEAVEFLKERFRAAGIDFEVNAIGVNDSDWNENWKKYFHVSEIGEKLVIVPSWEEYDNKNNRTVLNIDPGAAFGTGTHATTSLCLTLLEKHINNGVKMLDIGSGSGILAIASTLLGAESAIGVDIDAQSVKTAKENAEINNVQDKCEFLVGDLADKISGKFNVICANIVADVIIKLFDNVADFMEDDAVLIISGIIDLRKDDVLNSAAAHGFHIIEENYKDNWCAFTLTK
jgi:ribosomal protein L11 methyltransferase